MLLNKWGYPIGKQERVWILHHVAVTAWLEPTSLCRAPLFVLKLRNSERCFVSIVLTDTKYKEKHIQEPWRVSAQIGWIHGVFTPVPTRLHHSQQLIWKLHGRISALLWMPSPVVSWLQQSWYLCFSSWHYLNICWSQDPLILQCKMSLKEPWNRVICDLEYIYLKNLAIDKL